MSDIIDQEKLITVSYSQYSTFKTCPYSWYLSYVKKLKKYEGNINTVFGTAIHETLQLYIKTLYDKNADEADSLNLMDIFKNSFDENIKKENLNVNELEYNEFYTDGEEIIKYFTAPKNRLKYFPSKKYEVLGIELPLEVKLKNETIQYSGYIDIALKDKQTNKILILDLKTSSRGWNEYQKKDDKKLNQLLLYKIFYSKLYNIDIKNIDVEFIVLKRKLLENVDFPQNRLQKIVPSNGTVSCKTASNDFNDFLNIAFKDGKRNENVEDYPRTPGKNRKNCKYCDFSNLNGGKCFGERKTEY
jgi:hypothetical protein